MQNVVVIGNCQAEVVAQGLRNPALSPFLSVKCHFVDLPEEARLAGSRDLAECQTVLVQDISNFDDYPLRADIPERAEIIRFPCLRLASLWPFDSQNGPGDAQAQGFAAAVFTHFDGLLARLRTEVPEREARFQAYRSLAVDGVVNFHRMHQFEERHLSALDRRFNCRIGQFVIDNFRTARLFSTTGQPKPALYRLLLQWLMPHLGIRGDYPDDGCLAPADLDEVPVHPAVANALDVTWANEATLYRFDGRPTRWEEYVRRYIEYFG